MLNKIIETKIAEVKLLKKELIIEDISLCKKKNDFAKSLIQDNGYLSIIAEVKKASPVKGVICSNFDPVFLSSIYENNGSAAISVITDKNYFHGSIENLALVKNQVSIPVLRKDFIIDEIQLFETVMLGADAVLLIAGINSHKSLLKLVEKSIELGIEPLVEVNDKSDLSKSLDTPARVIGINNRNLNNFSVNIDITLNLVNMMPVSIIKVSESGISDTNQLAILQEAGVNAALVGEAIVSARDISKKVKELCFYWEKII